MSTRETLTRDLSCLILMGLFALGLVILAVRLKEVQIDQAANYNYAATRQSVRRIQTDGPRGRILDRNGVVLADNQKVFSIVCYPEAFSRRTWQMTCDAIAEGIAQVAELLNTPSPLDMRTISRHVNQQLARPLVAWPSISWETAARFSEHASDFPGFACHESAQRRYPLGSLAAHAIGYVRRDEVKVDAGDEKFKFRELEMVGCGGLERYYNEFLRGVPGEEKVLVDARCFAIENWTVSEPRTGPDLKLTLDVNIQRAVEEQLRGQKGACVVMDPRNGELLAFASSPTYDLNSCVPRLSHATYFTLTNNPAQPLLNRASGGLYAPGSTFKPVTALAGLAAGHSPTAAYECNGVYALGDMHLKCARRWGHGNVDMAHALMNSCNPYFCNLGMIIGTNAIFRTAHALGLGEKTGIDLMPDYRGCLPDAEWKQRVYGEKWVSGDLPQMSIGQGMLLVSPLQMVRVAGAIATGYLTTPHFNIDLVAARRPVPFSQEQLDVIRRGMRLVVCGTPDENGTGRRGGEDVPVAVAGKTGTAEVGARDQRRKNTWFIAFAPYGNPTLALAIVIENGESGGGTAAPRAAAILRAVDWKRRRNEDGK